MMDVYISMNLQYSINSNISSIKITKLWKSPLLLIKIHESQDDNEKSSE
jgi:hypothetical protein